MTQSLDTTAKLASTANPEASPSKVKLGPHAGPPARESSNGSIGRMQGLSSVSTPPRKATSNIGTSWTKGGHVRQQPNDQAQNTGRSSSVAFRAGAGVFPIGQAALLA